MGEPWPAGKPFCYSDPDPDATDEEILAGWYRAAVVERLVSTGNVEVHRPEVRGREAVHPWAEGPVRELHRGERMPTSQRPSVGRVVHYVSYGTPGGEFKSQCRAATVTEISVVGADETVGLAAINPTGLFFHPLAVGGCEHSEDDHRGGTWHWPERVE